MQALAGGATRWQYRRAAAAGDLDNITELATGAQRWGIAGPRDPGHELTRVAVDGTVLAVAHDAAGRVTASGDRAYTYHPDGQLAVVTDQGVHTLGHAYTANGRLAAVWGGPATTPDVHYAYDGGQQVAAVRPGTGPLWTAVWGVGADHLLAWTDLATSREYVPLLDQRGSTVAVWSPADGRRGGRRRAPQAARPARR